MTLSASGVHICVFYCSNIIVRTDVIISTAEKKQKPTLFNVLVHTKPTATCYFTVKS